MQATTITQALAAADLEAYRRDGFIILRGLYSPNEMVQVGAWLDELANRPLEAGKLMVYFEDSLKTPGQRIVTRIEKFVDHHAELGQLVSDDRLLAPLRELLGGEPLLFKEKINFKLPGGSGFAPHQDIQPGWDDYAPFFVTALIAIDPSTSENGCLELGPGQHTRGLIGRKWEPLSGPELEGLQFVEYPVEPGDVVFFDCYVPHQSKPNLTEQPRRNLYLTYNRRSDGDHRHRYFADKRRGYPPDFEREPDKTYTYKV